MLERAREVTRHGPYTYIEYARFADDLVILVDVDARHDWLFEATERRLRGELAKLQIEINAEKSRCVDLAKGESFGFLGFEFRRVRSLKGKWRANYSPKLKQRTAFAAQAQGHLPGLRLSAGGAGGATHQSDSARLDELLRHRQLQSLLQLCQMLGGEEDAPTFNAGPQTQRLRLEEVE